MLIAHMCRWRELAIPRREQVVQAQGEEDAAAAREWAMVAEAAQVLMTVAVGLSVGQTPALCLVCVCVCVCVCV